MGGDEDVADADSVCFDFHIQYFAELAELPDDVDQRQTMRLQDLSISLFQRLLASGLIDMDTAQLLGIVSRYMEVYTADEKLETSKAVLKTLRPPAVLFNRK